MKIDSSRSFDLEPAQSARTCRPHPRSHLFSHGKMMSGIVFIASAQRVSIHFQWYRLVAASTQKSAYVKLGKTRNAKLPILFNVDKFVKKQTIRERNMGHDFVCKCNGCHRRLIWQVVETQIPQHWVKIRVGHSFPFQHEQSSVVDKLREEKSSHRAFLFCR